MIRWLGMDFILFFEFKYLKPKGLISMYCVFDDPNH